MYGNGLEYDWKKRYRLYYMNRLSSIGFSSKHKTWCYRQGFYQYNKKETKDFYTELSHISREYIEAKYFIRTLEMTTNEIKESRLLFPIENSWLNDCFKEFSNWKY